MRQKIQIAFWQTLILIIQYELGFFASLPSNVLVVNCFIGGAGRAQGLHCTLLQQSPFVRLECYLLLVATAATENNNKMSRFIRSFRHHHHNNRQRIRGCIVLHIFHFSWNCVPFREPHTSLGLGFCSVTLAQHSLGGRGKPQSLTAYVQTFST